MINLRGKSALVIVTFLLAGIAIAFLLSRNDLSETGRLRLPTGTRTPAIALGQRHGLILASDGSLWSWGSDFLGWPVLGQTNANRYTSLHRIGNETNWQSICASHSRNLAIKTDGTLWTWGMNVGFRFSKPAFFRVPTQVATGNDWIQAAAGVIHSIALKRDGTLWGWGDNSAGSVGIGTNRGSGIPLQIGSATNWTRAWAGGLETVAMQSDGSLWYWGENPNPAIPQGANQIFDPTRVNDDTNWLDVGFGVNTVFAIKSDGTLWAWGRHADVYTGASSPAECATPRQVGTNSDWRAFARCADWWIQGIIKKNGSLWVMDASEDKPNGPATPAQPPRFFPVKSEKKIAAFASGAVHATAPGAHGSITVILTPDGEVWTWGMVLGDPASLSFWLQARAVQIANFFHIKAPPPTPPPVFRDRPWQLRNIDPGASP